MAKNSFSMMSLIKTGFGLSIGIALSQMIFIFIGLVFFIPGFIMYKTGSSKKDKSIGLEIGGIVLMGIGVIIMAGLGFGFLMSSIGEVVSSD